MKILFTPAAEADLAGIWAYTVTTWGVDQAVAYTTNIKTSCLFLDTAVIHSSAEHIRLGYKKVIIGKHVIYYTIHNDQLTIVRILHQSMDVSSHIE